MHPACLLRQIDHHGGVDVRRDIAPNIVIERQHARRVLLDLREHLVHQREHDLLLPLHALVVALGRVCAVADIILRALTGERHGLSGGETGKARIRRNGHTTNTVNKLADTLHIDRSVGRDRQVIKQA